MRKNTYVNSVAEEHIRQKQRENKVLLSSKEQLHGSALTEIGKQSRFTEYYHNISPIDQDYTSIEGYNYISRDFTKEEMIETIPFKKGYNYADIILRTGTIPERYQEEPKKHR